MVRRSGGASLCPYPTLFRSRIAGFVLRWRDHQFRLRHHLLQRYVHSVSRRRATAVTTHSACERRSEERRVGIERKLLLPLEVSVKKEHTVYSVDRSSRWREC